MGRSKRMKRKRQNVPRKARTSMKWRKDRKTVRAAAPESEAVKPETEKLSVDSTENRKEADSKANSVPVVSILCCICLDTLSVDDEPEEMDDSEEDLTDLQPTFCGHVFHNLCLTRWLKLSLTCPVCRDPVDPDPFLRPARIPGK